MGLFWCIIVGLMLLVEGNEESIGLWVLGFGFGFEEEGFFVDLIGAVGRGPRTGRPVMPKLAYCFCW